MGLESSHVWPFVPLKRTDKAEVASSILASSTKLWPTIQFRGHAGCRPRPADASRPAIALTTRLSPIWWRAATAQPSSERIWRTSESGIRASWVGDSA